MYNEIRYRSLQQQDPERAAMLLESMKAFVKTQWANYKYLSDRPF